MQMAARSKSVLYIVVGVIVLSAMLANGELPAKAADAEEVKAAAPRQYSDLPPGSLLSRTWKFRAEALVLNGGTRESEAAVVKGLRWLAIHQKENGSWHFDDDRFKDAGQKNDKAATAMALLPFLGAGLTHHKAPMDEPFNPYDAVIKKALDWLIEDQQKNGDLGGGIQAHAMATIALCEAYILSRDPQLREPAQKAVAFLAQAQHEGGGWGYAPKEKGRLSISGWCIAALTTAQAAELEVPPVTLRKATMFLDQVYNSDNGGYGDAGPTATETMTAVGLLCRQKLQSWGPRHLQMLTGVKNHIKTHTPAADYRNIHYYHHATQVMFNLDGADWKAWNEQMRELLVRLQMDDGSWSSAEDSFARSGGRLMATSLALLTLEVTFRSVPLFARK